MGAIGALLVVLAILNGDQAVGYLIGLALLVGAAVTIVALCSWRHARRWIFVGTAGVVALGAAAAAVAVPRAALAADRGDVLVTFDANGDLVGASQVGDVIVLQVFDESAALDYVIVDPESGNELGRHPSSNAGYADGRGPVAAVDWTTDDTFTAIGLDGSELWTWSTGLWNAEAVALYDDGTLVLSVPVEDEHGYSSSALVAIGPDGAERWRQELPFGFRAVTNGASNSTALPNRLLAVRQNPVQHGERLIMTIDPATGALAPVDPALTVAAGVGYFAYLDASPGVCTVRFHDDQNEPSSSTELDCPERSGQGVSMTAGENHVVVAAPTMNVVYYVDARTGDVERFTSDQVAPPLASNLMYVAEEPPTEWRRVGGEAITSPADGWFLSLEANLDTARAFHGVERHNPLGAGEQVEVALFDVATGERCADARVDAVRTSSTGYDEQLSERSSHGLPGCRAVVEVDGTITLIGSRRSS